MQSSETMSVRVSRFLRDVSRTNLYFRHCEYLPKYTISKKEQSKITGRLNRS